MANVYEVINILREGKYMSMRELARQAGISSTTMASIMSRKPKDVSVEFLGKVARAFGVHWYDFYGSEPEIYDKYNDKRVSSFVTDDAKDEFLHKMLGQSYDEMRNRERAEFYRSVEQTMDKYGLSGENLSLENCLYQGIFAVLKDLNTDGLHKAFNSLMEIAKDESYLKKQ